MSTRYAQLASALTVAVVLSMNATVSAQQSQTPPAQPPANPAPAPASPSPPSSGAQPPASQQPASPAGSSSQAGGKPAAGALTFSSDAGLVLFTVKTDSAADFEAFFAKVREALEKGTNPEYKPMAAGWKLYKVTDAAQSGQSMYACVMDPAVKGGDYDPIKILSDVAPADAVALYPKLKDAIVSVNRLNLSAAIPMGQ